MTSRFGGGREFNGAMQTQHMGVDFAGAKGSPIRATNRGVVVLVDDFFLGGHVVYIDHGGGLVTGYLHMTRSDVAEGDTVTRGQVIGRVGSSGRATGPHLHWAVRYGNITVDGLSLLSLERRSRRVRLTACRSDSPRDGSWDCSARRSRRERRSPSHTCRL